MDLEKFKEGVSLFNRGLFFEAHEVWEEIWLKDKKSETGRLLMGLIQWAAALLKEKQGKGKPALSLAKSALEKLERVNQKTARSLGLDLEKWIDEIKQKTSPRRLHD